MNKELDHLSFNCDTIKLHQIVYCSINCMSYFTEKANKGFRVLTCMHSCHNYNLLPIFLLEMKLQGNKMFI